MNQPDGELPFQPEIGMGTVQVVYRQKIASKIMNLFGSLLFLIAGGLILLYGYNYKNSFPDVASANTPWIYGFGLLIFGLGAYWAWDIFSKWKYVAVLFQNGFTYFNGRKASSFKWDEITSVTQAVTQMSYYGVIPAGTTKKFTIEGPAGILKMDGTLSKVDELLAEIRKNSYPCRFERQMQELNGGKTLQYGPLSISKAGGIEMKNKKIVWADIADMRIQNGNLEIVSRQKGLFKNISTPVGKTSNIDVFVGVSQAMAQQANQAAK
jgi:hypothetical protein